MSARDRIMLAVDVDSLEKMTVIVDLLRDHVGFFKVGLELISSVGAPKIIEHIHKLGGKVFFDGKFSDIPNTVAKASRAISTFQVDVFNVHANCGRESMKAASREKKNSKILAVTVLTSIDTAESIFLFGKTPQEKVAELARAAIECQMDGIICSPEELDLLTGPQFHGKWKVTPGVRPVWADSNDQKRTLTPYEAIKKGATHLVIGRPILNPPALIGSPVDAAKKITEEIELALSEMKDPQ